MASPLAVANAYANIARLAAESAGATPPAAGSSVAGGTSFASVLKDALGEVEGIGHRSDMESRALANGKGNMVDVVTAVAQTEVAIDAVVAVRDKVISAYQNIMSMPI